MSSQEAQAKPKHPPPPEITLNFSTPIMQLFVPNAEAVNRELKTLLLAKEQETALPTSGKTRSNRGGWRSDDDILTWEHPAIHSLQKEVVKAINTLMVNAASNKKQAVYKGMKLAAFANINRHGSYNANHAHPHNHWAAVYYVDIGHPDPDHPQSGLIEFQDPRTAATGIVTPGFDFNRGKFRRPQSGMMLVFPAWLYHSVHPFYGEGERISIAFNIELIL